MSDNQPHILVIDDDPEIRKPLSRYLEKHGFRSSVASDGTGLDAVLATASIDLIVLDVMLPGEDGLHICRRIQDSLQLPVILLTALADDSDRIVGLEMGADDYVTKPFNPRELVARIKSVLRRGAMLPKRQKNGIGRVSFSDWNFNLSSKELIDADGLVVRLSSSEHMLLVSLIEHAGITLNRHQLLDLTKGRDAQLFDRSIDNQISRLRRKIEIDPQNPAIILTKWGGGYVFAADLTWLE